MHDGHGWPAEALLLAALHQLGRLAGDFLACSALMPRSRTCRWVDGSQGSSPLLALRQLIELLETSEVAWGDRPAASAAGTGKAAKASGQARAGPALEACEAVAARAQTIARQLEGYWLDQPPPSTLERYGEDVDLSTPQGRWELLALAVLLGAPVARYRVEETFCALRRQGLLALEQVVAAEGHWVQAVDVVLETWYRGPVRRTAQRDRLVRAARVLVEQFGGDLQRIWELAAGDVERCRQLLRQSFDGVDRLAGWMLREMGRKGAWPDAHRHPAALYVDVHVRRVLENLGLLEAGSSLREAERRVLAAFGGVGTALFYQGRERCGRRSLAVCLKHCTVSQFCVQLRRWVADGEGPNKAGQNRETPAKRPAGARQVRVEPAGGAAIL